MQERKNNRRSTQGTSANEAAAKVDFLVTVNSSMPNKAASMMVTVNRILSSMRVAAKRDILGLLQETY